MSKICEHCGATIPDNYILCTKCGEAVEDKPDKKKKSKTKKIVLFSCIGVVLIGIGLTMFFLLRPSIVGKWKYTTAYDGHLLETVYEFKENNELTLSYYEDEELKKTTSGYYKYKNKTLYAFEDKNDLEKMSNYVEIKIEKLTYKILKISGSSSTFTRV